MVREQMKQNSTGPAPRMEWHIRHSSAVWGDINLAYMFVRILVIICPVCATLSGQVCLQCAHPHKSSIIRSSMNLGVLSGMENMVLCPQLQLMLWISVNVCCLKVSRVSMVHGLWWV